MKKCLDIPVHSRDYHHCSIKLQASVGNHVMHLIYTWQYLGACEKFEKEF